jgi:formylglycine-generating enzyme required for sulfatase activity
VLSFRASKHKVTNAEFHAFVAAGGYISPQWWSEEGWGWRTFRNVK